MKWIILIPVAVLLSACGTISPNLPMSDTVGVNHGGIYATSFNADGSIRTQWWLESHREDYNKLATAYPQYGVSVDSHLTKVGSLWKADVVARKQYAELNEIKKMDQFGQPLPKSL